MAESALRSAPQNEAAWRLHATVLERQGRVLEALDSYYRSLSYDAHDSDTLLAVAELHHQLGRPSRTLATLQQLDNSSVGGVSKRRVWRTPRVGRTAGWTIRRSGRISDESSRIGPPLRGIAGPTCRSALAARARRTCSSCAARRISSRDAGATVIAPTTDDTNRVASRGRPCVNATLDAVPPAGSSFDRGPFVA